MVTIKIQSKEDVIAAYLQSFGFSARQLPEIVGTVAAHLDFHSDNGDELIKKVDEILLQTARNTFPNSTLENELLLAQFKLCFLLCNGAEQCSKYGMKGLNLPEPLVCQMQERYICNAPSYRYAEMKPQTIEGFGTRKRKKK